MNHIVHITALVTEYCSPAYLLTFYSYTLKNTKTHAHNKHVQL